MYNWLRQDNDNRRRTNHPTILKEYIMLYGIMIFITGTVNYMNDPVPNPIWAFFKGDAECLVSLHESYEEQPSQDQEMVNAPTEERVLF